MRALRAVPALAALALAAAAAAAPAPPARLAVDRVRVTGNGRHELVVRAQDENGAPVDGLESVLSVTLDERGVGEIRATWGGTGQRTLVAVVDAPLLGREGAAVVDDALRAVAREMAPGDRVVVVVAGDKTTTKEWSAREMTQAGERLSSLASGGGPRLYDALKVGADLAAGHRRLSSGALLVVTRGADRGSRARTNEVLAAALRGGVTSLDVVVVPGAGGGGDTQQLERLAALTGGSFWHAQPGAPVPPSLGPGVLATLDRYRVTFNDSRWRRDDETHQLEVRAGDSPTGPAATASYRAPDVYEPDWWATPALWVVLVAVLVIAAFVVLGQRRRQVCLLVVQGGEEDGQWYEVFDLPLRIGSAAENDIVLVSEGVSRNHCLLQREGRSIVLVDTNSEFGSFVNGARVNRHELEEDDVIRLGTDVELAYEGR
jgi:hypothetical protein